MVGRQQPPPALPDDCYSFNFQVYHLRPPRPVEKTDFEVGVSSKAVKGENSGLKLLKKRVGTAIKTGEKAGGTEHVKLLVPRGRFRGKYDTVDALFRAIQAAVASYVPDKPFHLYDTNIFCFVGLSCHLQKEVVEKILAENELLKAEVKPAEQAAKPEQAPPAQEPAHPLAQDITEALKSSSLVDNEPKQADAPAKAAAPAVAAAPALASTQQHQDLLHPLPRRVDKSLPTLPSILDPAPAVGPQPPALGPTTQNHAKLSRGNPSDVKHPRIDPHAQLSREALAATEIMEEWIEAQLRQKRYYFQIQIHGYDGPQPVRIFYTAQPLPSEADVRMWAMARWGEELLDPGKWRLTLKGGGDFIKWRSEQLNLVFSPSDASGQDTPQVNLSFVSVNPKLVIHNPSPAGTLSNLPYLQSPSGLNTPGLYSVPPSYRNTPQVTLGRGFAPLPKAGVEKSPRGVGVGMPVGQEGQGQAAEPGHVQFCEPVRELPGGWIYREDAKEAEQAPEQHPETRAGSSNGSQSPKRSPVDTMVGSIGSLSNRSANTGTSGGFTPASRRSPRTPGSPLPTGPVMNTAAFVEVGMRLARADPALFSELMVGESTSPRGEEGGSGLGFFTQPDHSAQAGKPFEHARPIRPRAVPSHSYGPGPAVPSLKPIYYGPVPPRPDLPEYVHQCYPSSGDSPHGHYNNLPGDRSNVNSALGMGHHQPYQYPYPVPWPPTMGPGGQQGKHGHQQWTGGLPRSAMSSGALPDLVERDEEVGTPVQRSLSASRTGTC
ncbi:hypothetical protein IAT38_005129 [Cryptococcus sp. DSM 104549]